MAKIGLTMSDLVISELKKSSILTGESCGDIVEDSLRKYLKITKKKKKVVNLLPPTQYKLLEFFDKHHAYWFYIAQLEKICVTGKIDMKPRNVSYCLPILNQKKLIEEINPPEFVKKGASKFYQITDKGRRVFSNISSSLN
jgi:DNA-binding MarR family transcriptional regulator